MKKSVFIGLLVSLIFLMNGIPERSGDHASMTGKVEVTLLGPKQYLRTTGKPNIYTDAFPGRFGQGKLIAKNGDANGDDRISSAIIKINGVQIFGTSDFNQNVQFMERTTNLQEENSISIELRSKPGSFLIIQIDQDIEADAAMVIGNSGGMIRVTSDNSPLFGYNLSVPPNALDKPIVISMQHAAEINPPINSNIEERINLPAFRISPDNIILNGLATIRVPLLDMNDDDIFDGTDLPLESARFSVFDTGDLEMVRMESRIDKVAKEIVVKTSHFSLWLPWLGRWKKGSQLKYYVESVPSNEFYSAEGFRSEIYPALKQWSDAVDGIITFVEVSSELQADIKIKATDMCTLSYFFKLYCNSAAITSSPIERMFNCTVALNIGNNSGMNPFLWFTVPYGEYPPPLGNYEYLPFTRILLHEFGHVMGLPEYSDKETYEPCNFRTNAELPIMYYDCGSALPFLVSLSAFDIKEVRRLYGLSTSGQNLAPNPSFESGSGQWPDGWEPSYPSMANYIWDNTVAHTGSRSLGITHCTKTNTSAGWITTDFIYVDPTKEHEVSLWYLWSDTQLYDERAGLCVFEYDNQGNFTQGFGTVTLPNVVGSWQYYKWKCYPFNAKTVKIEIVILRAIFTSSNYNATLWFDDVKFIQK